MAFMYAVQVCKQIFDFIYHSPIFLAIILSCPDVSPIIPILFSTFLCIHMLEMYIFEFSILIFLKEWNKQVKVALNCHIYFNGFEFMVVVLMVFGNIVLLLGYMMLVAHLIYISLTFAYRILSYKINNWVLRV